MLEITRHGKHRIHKRCGIKSKGAERLAKIAFERGLTHAETTGSLNGYLTRLYMYNRQANNIRLYGDKVYVFCDETLVTVLDTPLKYRRLVNKLMEKKKHDREDKNNPI
jgi:hypothetical protein